MVYLVQRVMDDEDQILEEIVNLMMNSRSYVMVKMYDHQLADQKKKHH